MVSMLEDPMSKKNPAAYVLATVAFCAMATAATPRVVTVAGGFLGDGRVATSASLAQPVGVARDSNGNIYTSDSNNCRIRKVSKTGVITTYAGTGICGFSGDGGPATAAMISNPYGLSLDNHGNLLFADPGNSRIRQITPAGVITTIAGNGTFGYSGDGGPAVSASLGAPFAVAADAMTGKIYIADSGNYVIRVVNTAGIIQTIAGNHTYGFSGDGGPATSAEIGYVEGLRTDSHGNLYIADTNNERVRKVDASGIITTYAGNGLFGNSGNGGPATSASIGTVFGVFPSGGKLYISTNGNIWAVNQTTQTINIVAGGASGSGGYNGDGNTALSALFANPWGMTSNGAGGLLVADSGNDRIRQISATQLVKTVAGGYVGDGGKSTAASLDDSTHLALDVAGNLYIADALNNRIRKVAPNGTITTFAGTGLTGYTGDGGPATSATLNRPEAVAVDTQSNVYIADYQNGVIRKVDSTGTISTFVTTFGFGVTAAATALTFGPDGNLYATGLWGVSMITSSGSTTMIAGVPGELGYNGDGIPATQAWLFLPNGLAFDSVGNLYISDWLNNRIRKVDGTGIISTVAGNGQTGFSGDGGPATSATLFEPTDVAVSVAGNLYIADANNFRVRTVDPAGTINTYAGSGGIGYNGDNLPATQTNLFPNGLAIAPNGIIYVSDDGSYRVRRIH
jgi:sugar lactone lactonase YvrE